jgi:hypothetical protein
MVPLCSLEQLLKDASTPHTSATTVIAASNAHSLPCSATVVDQQPQIQSQARAHAVDIRPCVAPAELAAANILQYLNLLILEPSLRSQ